MNGLHDAEQMIWRRGILRDMVTRVIQICRRIDGEGKLVHWHVGFPADREKPPPSYELLRSKRCSRSWAASSISLCRHSAAR